MRQFITFHSVAKGPFIIPNHDIRSADVEGLNEGCRIHFYGRQGHLDEEIIEESLETVAMKLNRSFERERSEDIDY